MDTITKSAKKTSKLAKLPQSSEPSQTNRLSRMKHDRFFKDSMQDKQIARDFFRAHLPGDIKREAQWDTLTLENVDFVDSKEYHGDILYSLELSGELGTLYLVTEHFSTITKLTALRIREYEHLTMRRHIEKHRGQPAPLVIPLVFYNGRQPYLIKPDILNLYTPSSRRLAEKYLFKPPLLIDVGRIDDEELKTHGDAHIMELIMKHVKEPDAKWMMGLDMSHFTEEHRDAYVRHAISYVLGSLPEESKPAFLEIVQQLNEPIGETVMTLAESFRQEGRQEGRVEEKSVMMKKLRKTLSPKVFNEVLGVLQDDQDK